MSTARLAALRTQLDHSPETDRRHYTEAIAGTCAVSLAMFGSRWGSHLGVGPLFLTDILIALAVVHLIATRLRYPGAPPIDPSFRPSHPLVMVCLVWAIVRLVAGNRYDMDALRDAVPYLYAALGIVAAASLRRSTPVNRARAARLLQIALGAHAAWVFAATVAPGIRDNLPLVSAGLDLRVFALRWDFDTPIVGIFGALLLVRLMRGDRRPILTVIGLGLCVFTIIGTGSRAGLIGAFMVMLLGAVAGLGGLSIADRRKRVMIAVLPLLIAAVAAVVPQTTIGDRLIGTFGNGDSQNKSSANAKGTTEARDRTWQYLWEYSGADPERQLFGVGFGPNFLSETGASNLLVGSNEETEAEPRSPHNYWLGTLMRGGLLGVVLMMMLALVVLVRTAGLLTSMADDRLLFVACSIPVALLFPATVGVVLESPFGAVPYFWACGIVLSWPRPARRFGPAPAKSIHAREIEQPV